MRTYQLRVLFADGALLTITAALEPVAGDENSGRPWRA
jgi:hypothetical protein